MVILFPSESDWPVVSHDIFPHFFRYRLGTCKQEHDKCVLIYSSDNFLCQYCYFLSQERRKNYIPCTHCDKMEKIKVKTCTVYGKVIRSIATQWHLFAGKGEQSYRQFPESSWCFKQVHINLWCQITLHFKTWILRL